jgi:hypothetical protein
VHGEEDVEDRLQGDYLGVVVDFEYLGVARSAAADLPVGGVRDRSACVAGLSAQDALEEPEDRLGAPEKCEKAAFCVVGLYILFSPKEKHEKSGESGSYGYRS